MVDYEETNETTDYERGGSITISTTVDQRLWRLAKNYNLSWTKALNLGLELILSEIDPVIYPAPDCELKRKMLKFKEMLEEQLKIKE